MLDHLKAILHDYFSKTVAEALHSELAALRADVDRLIAKLEPAAVRPGAPEAPTTTMAVESVAVAKAPAAVEHATEPVAQSEPEHGKEVQETEAHS